MSYSCFSPLCCKIRVQLCRIHANHCSYYFHLPLSVSKCCGRPPHLQDNCDFYSPATMIQLFKDDTRTSWDIPLKFPNNRKLCCSRDFYINYFGVSCKTFRCPQCPLTYQKYTTFCKKCKCNISITIAKYSCPNKKNDVLIAFVKSIKTSFGLIFIFC